jgi:hypothetical protein
MNLFITISVSATAFAIGAASQADAQALQPTRHRHEIAHHSVASQGGDVIVPTGRSYLDPGRSAAVGTEDRYSYDTAHSDFRGEGPAFTRNTAGFELLPGTFDPPGQTEPLFVFNTPGYMKGER